ncbi:cytochrome P450 [Nocardia wallacei]|uniref:Cytochrome P450 n=1 Tax=Nocardia wallacei TaxID=480035 RepID=A0A7G1KM79_9NOCA|nr:cytochrome P450 [Nocardia wallacei]BCK56268.1 cytochrome P450 [Nocardia wallacei]
MSLWDTDPLRAIEQAIAHDGHVFTVHRPGKPPRVHVSSPLCLREVFLEHDGELRACGSRLLAPLVGEQSLGSLNGLRHKNVRRTLAPSLRGAALRRHRDDISAIAGEEIRRVAPGTALALSAIASAITTRVLLLYCFGALPDDRAAELSAAFDDAFGALHVKSTDPHRFGVARRRLDAAVAAEIGHAAHSVDGEDCALGRLLNAKDIAGSESCHRVVRDQLVTLLVAGRESTPNVIVHAVHQAYRTPAVRRALTDELTGSAADIESLRYLDAFHNEVLRVASVVPTGITRRCVGNFVSQGHEFLSGVEVVPGIHGVHRRADLYPNPERFDPDRFLRRKFSATEFLPYGLGARRCLGAALATLEIKSVLAAILTDPTVEVRINRHDRTAPQQPGPVVAAPGGIELARTSQR